MASNNDKNDIILYHYSFSPYARRIRWYLALRGINYAQVVQPVTMPRPDLELIGVRYRRIPVMAIGKDVYCDTRLMLLKLEKLFPGNTLGAVKPDQIAMQQLLQIWHVEAGLFMRASQLIPSNMPLMNDPKFVKDREQLTGKPWTKEQVDANRPEALVYVRKAFDFIESTLLCDGREWILSTEKPSLADIEAVWVFDWLSGMKLPPDIFSEDQYPRVFAWIKRFNKAVNAATEKAPKPQKLSGKDAAKRIFESTFVEEQGEVDAQDPLKLTKGALIDVWPVDSGFSHKDQGTLIKLSQDEVVIGKDNGIRVHFPRTGFRVRMVSQTKGSKI